MTLQSSDQKARLKYLEAVPVRMEVEAEGKQYVLVHATQMELYERLNDEAVNIDCGCGYPELGGQLGCLRLEDMTEKINMSDKPKINLSEQNSTILRDICFARMKVLKAGGICSADDLPRKKELMEFTARQSLPVFDFFRSAMAGNVEAAKRQSAVQQTMHPYACGGYYDGIIADYQSIMAALMLRGGYTEEDVQRLHSRVQGFIKSLKTDPARTLYSIPPKIKDQIPDYFYIAFAGELFSVYGWERSRLIFYPENNHAHADLESGTEGWAQAFRATCRKLETGWLLDYYNSLPWYERDVFDGIIEQEIRKNFMNGKDDNVNDYYQYLIEKMHRSER